jgi:hypothetical protein
MGGNNSKKETRPAIDPKYLQPQKAIYPHCKWDSRVVARLIVNTKLAPFYPGVDDPEDDENYEECPICFLVIIFPFFVCVFLHFIYYLRNLFSTTQED